MGRSAREDEVEKVVPGRPEGWWEGGEDNGSEYERPRDMVELANVSLSIGAVSKCCPGDSRELRDAEETFKRSRSWWREDPEKKLGHCRYWSLPICSLKGSRMPLPDASSTCASSCWCCQNELSGWSIQ